MAVGIFHLRPEEGGGDLAGQVGRADVDPGVLVHLAAEELAAVRALLADDLGALDEAPRSLMSSAPPSPEMMFLVSWKLTAPQWPIVPSGRPLYVGIEALGGVLDDEQAVAFGDRP